MNFLFAYHLFSLL